MSITQFLTSAILFFLIAVGLGFWVKAGGRPYKPLSFNLHKLVALGGVILAGIRFWKYYSVEGWLGESVFPAVLAGVSVALLFGTGAAMNIRKEDSRILRLFHQSGSVLIAFCMGWVIYLLW